ncbi:ChrR family anti-sigma-E factor [Salipiger marinus]|uniref:Anti-ECFsigma factor, ChrR n=1 Tax=Salipiger marinus TaxID=555512 RepID=A0A1G8Q259_9RHOB|nr:MULTISPECIES: ChrR family anti-sigma-E factor [Salipiger]MCD1619723.1 ChrR family anti-sigma-E factor [Salipiger manganoxidans]MEB3420578.1 ChrR family anti-sigma-E factor [Salipiger manganoxidans]SDI98834.1 anti-ECFsigma factor, ChrR [Salipiger marinus]
MSAISHHIPDHLIRAHAAGQLPHHFAVVVAAHLSMCDACRAQAEAEEMVGGALLDRLAPAALQDGARDRLLAALDSAPPPPPAPRRSGIFPAPVMQALDGQPPRWRMLGGGIRQQVLSADEDGSLRLLYIPPGRAVPEHGHNGLELTLVLQGAFSDSEGRFGVGDVELAEDDLDHQPVACPGAPCICLAATDAPLRFTAFLPRLLQPLFRI